jgi:hypothetical protein
MGNAGRALAIIGAVVGLLSVLLGLAIPAIFSWYHIELSYGPFSGGAYLTAFGNLIEDDVSLPSDATEMVTLVLVGGILVLAGAGLCIAGAATEQKPLGIIGGILMIIGPTMLIFDLMAQVSEFAQFMDMIAGYYDKSIFFGSFSPYPGYSIMWGLWVGYFIAYVGGVLGLIGGAIL